MGEFDDLYGPLKGPVESTARSVAKHYTNYTNHEDVAQALWEHVFKEADHFRGYIASDGHAGAIRVALTRKAHAFCEKQRTVVLGLEPRHDLYSPAMVRELLQDCFDYEDWQSFSQKGDNQPRGKRLEATSDRIAMLVDVKTAIEKLGTRQYSTLIAVYKYSYSEDQVAEMLEIATGSVKTTVSRAVDALCKILNPTDFDREYVGTRKVKSNAAARAELAHNWE